MSIQRSIAWSIATLLLVGLSAPAAPSAKSRDADGSRMQARKIAYPSVHTDELSPPTDRVDWRYFKLGEAADVSVSVAFDVAEASGSVRLTSATGRELALADAASGAASVDQKLEPGVYYVSVQTSAASAYTLTVR